MPFELATHSLIFQGFLKRQLTTYNKIKSTTRRPISYFASEATESEIEAIYTDLAAQDEKACYAVAIAWKISYYAALVNAYPYSLAAIPKWGTWLNIDTNDTIAHNNDKAWGGTFYCAPQYIKAVQSLLSDNQKTATQKERGLFLNLKSMTCTFVEANPNLKQIILLKNRQQKRQDLLKQHFSDDPLLLALVSQNETVLENENLLSIQKQAKENLDTYFNNLNDDKVGNQLTEAFTNNFKKPAMQIKNHATSVSTDDYSSLPLAGHGWNPPGQIPAGAAGAWRIPRD